MKIKIFLAFMLTCLNTFVFAANKTNHRIHDCVATISGKTYICSLGRNGAVLNKKEGDGATPVGTFILRRIFYRADRIDRHKIKSSLPTQALQKDDGWCDDVNHPAYNTHIKLPFAASHENLWRDDDVYDLIVVVSYNDQPVRKAKGSAIFIHIARKNYSPTAGCIAFSKKDLLSILKKLHSNTTVTISNDNKISFQ